jgi:hypothetical protein
MSSAKESYRVRVYDNFIYVTGVFKYKYNYRSKYMRRNNLESTPEQLNESL